MRKSFSKFAVITSISLALAFTFSCSNSEDSDPISSSSNAGISSSSDNGSNGGLSSSVNGGIVSSSSIGGVGISSSGDNGNLSSSSANSSSSIASNSSSSGEISISSSSGNGSSPSAGLEYVSGKWYCNGVEYIQNLESCNGWRVCGFGADAKYNESTHFCAAGDQIAPHCDDHQIYNPVQTFCSYVGNGTTFTSTPLPFCGNGTSSSNQYNNDMWKWEYCYEGSVVRCANLQIPAGRDRCQCIENASQVPNMNSCQCNAGYGYELVNGTPTCKLGSIGISSSSSNVNTSSSSSEEGEKKCGGVVYDERTHFCAVGNQIVPHCDDRQIYNPATSFCSYKWNGTTFTSTPLPYCGNEKYNDGSYKWEYCFSNEVVRCAQLQIPYSSDWGSVFCKCIENASNISATTNGCQCNAGYTLGFVDGTPTCK